MRVEGVSAKDQLLAWVNEDTALQVSHVSRVVTSHESVTNVENTQFMS